VNGVARSLHRVVLRMYPREFRDAFGDDMVQNFLDRRRYERRSSFGLLAAELVDAASVAPTMRWENPMNRILWLASGPAALVLVLALVGGGPIAVFALLGVVLAVFVMARGRDRLDVPVDAPRRAGTWVVGGALAIAVGLAIPAIDGGELNAFWWSAMALSLLAGMVLLTTGLLLVVVRHTPRSKPAS
jgi:hypothetical protein